MNNKIDLDNLTCQELREMILNEIISLEIIDAPVLKKVLHHEIDLICIGQGDMGIIEQCANLLNETNETNILSDDDITKLIEQTKSEHITLIYDKKKKTNDISARTKYVVRKMGLIVAIVSLLIVGTSIVTTAFGFDIFKYISDIVRKDQDAEINVNEFTFHNGGETKKYLSIEELLETEDLDIMFPSKLPSGIQIDRITLSKSELGNDHVQIITNDINTCIFIEINGNEPNGSHTDCTVYENNDLTYYIFQDNTFFASCYYNDCHYSIQAKSYDELIQIITNMKENN